MSHHASHDHQEAGAGERAQRNLQSSEKTDPGRANPSKLAQDDLQEVSFNLLQEVVT